MRETITVFGNTSDETRLEELPMEGGFGNSSVVISRHHKLESVQLSEFSTDDFGGAPVCRLRFGTGTRLYYLNLPLHHELDPRTSRVPLKVHSILRPSADDGWVRVSGEEMVEGFEIARE